MPARLPVGLGPRCIDLGNPVANHPLNVGVVAWWLPLANNSGTTTLFDIANRPGYNGALTNGPTWGPGPNGFGSLAFNSASSQYVELGVNPPIADFGTGPFSLACVFYRTSVVSGRQTFIRFDSDSGGRPGYWLFESGGGSGFGFHVAAATLTDVATGSYGAGVWTWAAATRDAAGNAVIYCNGQQVASTTGATGSAGGTARNLRLAGFNAGSYLSGGLSSVQIFKGISLSAAQISALYLDWRLGYPDTLRRFTPTVWSFGPGGAPPADVSFRKTLSGIGGRVGARQLQG